MTTIFSRVGVTAATATLLLLLLCGCNKGASDTAAKTVPPSAVTPEVQSQIDAQQKADAARLSAQAAKGK